MKNFILRNDCHIPVAPQDMRDGFYWEDVGEYVIDADHPSWASSHCQCPTTFNLDENRVRIIVSCRDKNQIARLGCVDAFFEADKFKSFNRISSDPMMSVGSVGTFDEHGLYPSLVINHQNQILLFYVGYSRGAEQPLFYTSIGVAKLSDDKNFFIPLSKAPILSRSNFDPCLITSPVILPLNEGWLMYYTSGFDWFRDEGLGLHSKYDIKIAYSKNLKDWDRRGEVAISLGLGETNISRPTLLMGADGVIHMWYCHVKDLSEYQIGYATSTDGIKWVRFDNNSGFQNKKNSLQKMQAYPHVFQVGKKVYMVYNRGNYGVNGFLIAEMKFN